MKKLFYVLSFILCLFISINIVYGKNVEKECLYTPDGYETEKFHYSVVIYSDDTAEVFTHYDTGKVSEGKGINNFKRNDDDWYDKINSVLGLGDVDGKGHDVLGYYKETGKCPENLYTYTKINFIFFITEYKFLSNYAIDDINFKMDDVSIYKLVSDENKYKPDDLTTCNYGTFEINFSKSTGIFGNVKSHYTSTEFYIQYNITEEMRNAYKKLDMNICPVVYTCVVSQTPNYFSYNLYPDSQIAKRNCGGKTPSPYHCESGEFCDSDYEGKCVTYSDKIDLIRDDYFEYLGTNDINFLNKANKEINELKSLCSDILSFTNTGDPCLTSCLDNLTSDLDSIGINKVVTQTCGFSDTLLAWIKNIIRIIKYIIPVIVIIFGIVDFIKAIASDKDDEMKKAQGRFIKRLIAAALVFIVPFIIEFILDKAGFINDECAVDLLGKIGL